MPTYEYACRDCGEHLEVVQSFKDDPLTVCPGCEGELRKVFSAAGIVFKGSGWHIKDYGTSTSKPPADKAASPDTAATPSSDTSDSGSSSDSGSDSGSGSEGTSSTSSDSERKSA